MSWQLLQLIFPLLAIVAWIVGFAFFNDMDEEEKAYAFHAPFMTVMSQVADKKPALIPVLQIHCPLLTPYYKTAVGTVYDGEKWLLKDITEDKGYDYLDLSSNTGVAAQRELSQTRDGFDAHILSSAKTEDDPLHLGLPGNISDRVMILARRITEGLQTPLEKAESIERFLRVRYRYNFDFAPAPSGWEPNDWFLFESQEGICRNFNSAFVILARAAGIPSRLVVGYYVKPGVEEQTVYSNQAHAWAEIRPGEEGWTTFDATPPVYQIGDGGKNQ